MRPYANLSRKSGVAGYQIGTGEILVRFTSGERYLYTYQVTGKRDVDEMINRARAGSGLQRYINTVVKGRYAEKL